MKGEGALTAGVTGVCSVISVPDLLDKSYLWAQGQDCFFQFSLQFFVQSTFKRLKCRDFHLPGVTPSPRLSLAGC